MSVGNASQAIDFDRNDLTLVLGENLDLGGDDSGARNGTGKTTIINALSYALFGTALTNIRKDNLVNKTNGKNMLVTVEFAKEGNSYRIERGRKPNILKLYVNDAEMLDDEAQGDSRRTQNDIERILDSSHSMFKHIVALNTYTEPFLAMRQYDQREIIEQLLGITQLSEKAIILKELVKESKDRFKEEEITIKAQIEANKKVSETIDNLERRKTVWITKHEEKILDLETGIGELEKINIKEELKAWKDLKKWGEANVIYNTLNTEYAHANKTEERCATAMLSASINLQKAEENKCPTCDQELHDDELVGHLKDVHTRCKEEHEEACEHITEIVDKMEDVVDPGEEPETFYEDEHDALDHRVTLKHLKEQLSTNQKEKDPYTEQIDELREQALTEITYDFLNELDDLRDHQEFLLKLLTNKDSFIRKKIIDQNLSYLNKRLSYYLSKIGLPHTVVFQNDLTVEIMELGRELDFDNLSRGERNRLILSLSWSFRDVYESLYEPINLLFIDELIDSGLDQKGMEDTLGILKKMSRDRNKAIFLVSHRDELTGRVNNILKVTKENGFTNYSNDIEYI